MHALARVAVAASVVAVALAPASARADDAGPAVFYVASSLSGVVTIAGTGVALGEPPKKDDGGTMLGWGVASSISAGLNLGWAGYLFYQGSQPCAPSGAGAWSFGGGFCELGNALDILGGAFQLFIGVPNVALAIAAFYRGGHDHTLRASSGSLRAPHILPLAMPAARGSTAPGLGVTGVF